jgi:hypothetical protein
LDARRPLNGSRDLLLLDGVVGCDCSGRDTPSAMDAGGPLVHNGIHHRIHPSSSFSLFTF